MKRTTFSRLLSLVLVLMLGAALLTGCSMEEQAWTRSSEEGDLVYVDLISIEPMTKVGSSYNGSVVTNYTETACVCYTTSGDEVWVYIEIAEYKALFDSTADFYGDNWWADRVDFSSPVRIHGKVEESEELCDGLSIDIGSSLIVVFESKE